MLRLVGLLLLTALVWWRVLNRKDSTSSASPSCSTSSASNAVLPTPGAVTVVVLNSTARKGIAAAARRTLLADGFRIPDQAANDVANRGKVPGVAEIRYPPDTAPGAKLLSYYFPTATLTQTTATDGKVVVSLGTKYVHIATPAAVRLALQRDNVRLQKETGNTPVSTTSC